MQYFEMSDEELVSQLASFCLDGRRAVTRVIVHLIEVEDRDLDRKSACDSMWSFCTKRMRMSEGETSRRLNAVKLVRRFPLLLGRIERGEIHLSSLKILGAYLDESNYEELLDAAKWKTKMEVRELIAARFPRPDAPTVETEVPAKTELLSPGVALPEAKVVSKIEPLSATGCLVQTTLSEKGYANLKRAKELMRHRIPGGDTSKVLETALEVLVAKIEKELRGKTSRPQKKRRPSKPGHVPAAVRREVFKRDGDRCTFCDDQGRRCEARTLLELDHVEARAKGGNEDPSNLRVRCRAHNQMYAEEVFGKEHVEERIHYRQHQAQRVKEEKKAMTHVAHGSPVSPETIAQATRGLVNMGFGKKDVLRTIESIAAHCRDGVSVQDVLREAIARLT